MEIRTDIRNIINQYADADIGIEDPLRENFLRFQRNVNHVLGLKAGMPEYNKLRGVLALNHDCERNRLMDNIFNIVEFASSQSPCIYVSLHLGCYEEIVTHLIKKVGKICIPVTERVFLQETGHYNKNLAKRGITSSQLVFVNIESCTGFRQMIRYARNGYSLLCYIDGNSGIGGMARHDSKLERVDFFNTAIHVRKGVDFLAKMLNRDIIPVYSYIEDFSYQPHIVIMSPVAKISKLSITDCLWRTFSRAIWKYYWQWEPWLYVDEFIVHTTGITPKRSGYVLNDDRYLPLIKSGVCYYYDNQTNKLVKVGSKLYRLLSALGESGISTRAELTEYIPQETLVEDLLNKKIIVKL